MRAISLVLGPAAALGEAASSSLSPMDFSIADVAALLVDWKLDRSLGDCFADMQVDGEFLSMLAPDNDNEVRAFCPRATAIHWTKLQARLEAWKANPYRATRENDGITVDVNAVDGEAHQRRSLAASSASSGIAIVSDEAMITLGADREVMLMRTGQGALTIQADVNITGSLVAASGTTTPQCASVSVVDTSTSYNGTIVVRDGDFVDMSSVACAEGWNVADAGSATWACGETGGVATAIGDLCVAMACSSVDVSDYTLHGGVYNGATQVTSGQLLTDVGSIDSCTTHTSTGPDDLSVSYVPRNNAVWICREEGGVAVPNEQLCQCEDDVCSDWTLIVADASYGGTWDSEYEVESSAYGDYNQLIAVWKSGYVSCDSDYDQYAADYPWNACGATHSGCSGTDLSFELKINGEYLLSQSNWCTLPDQCEDPSPATGDIYCTVDFTLAEGDTVTPTWYEASRQSSTHDNTGTIYVDLYGYRTS